MRIERFLDELATRTILDLHGVEQPALLRATTDPKLGDYQINAAMPLAKRLGRPPRELAAPLADAMAKHEPIAKAEVAGPGFVNLTLDDAWVAARLLEDLADQEHAGVPRADRTEKIVVDFSSPNIAKQMHVGHLRSTIIGDAICRLLRFVGHDVIRDNHLGDWGTQFGLLIVGMREWGDEAALAREPIVELERVYKLATAKAKEDEAFAATARAELAKLQSGDPDNLAMWQRFVQATRVALDRVYEKLGVTFDQWLGESAYDDMLPGVIELLLEQGIAREDQGALCVFFDDRTEDVVPARLKKQKEPFIVRKKDGAFLYSTTDIATVLYRRDQFHADKALYVVDNGQGLHFEQLFTVMKLLGVTMELEHVGFGVVLGKDKKRLRTRDASGKVTTLESLLDEAEKRAEEVLTKALGEGKLKVAPEDVADVAHAVGIGAVKYADLSQNRASDYVFDWDKMISFDGNAGPYLQYAYARTRNIFVNGEVDSATLTGPIQLVASEESALAGQLLRFGEIVHAAAEASLPHFVAEHLYALARAFSAFYTKCPVLKSEGATRASRLALTELTSRQMRLGLGLLGIETVERM